MRSYHVIGVLCWSVLMPGCAAVKDRPAVEPWPGATTELHDVIAVMSDGPTELKRSKEQRDHLRDRATLDGDMEAAWQLRNAYLGQRDLARAYVWLKFLAKNRDQRAIALMEAERYSLTYEETLLLFSDNDEEITKVTGRRNVPGKGDGATMPKH